MKKLPIKLGVILLAIVIGAIFLNKYVMKGEPVSYPKPFINLGNYLFLKAENFGGFVRKMENFNRLASENDKLKQNQGLVLSLQAKIDNLENENDFLRRTARFTQKLNYPVVYAGIFNLNLAPTGYNVLLNKGVRDGVSEGDIVVTAEGVLVGKIQTVMQNFSRVTFISDSDFKITVKVLSSGTSGIARGALNEGMYLDFVIQSDDIKEQDILISTGNDQFPPALIVGSVDYVETNASQIFKKVRIRPAVKDTRLGRVIVIKIK
jgi:rod shape-determining protein MreC